MESNSRAPALEINGKDKCLNLTNHDTVNYYSICLVSATNAVFIFPVDFVCFQM